MKATPFGDFPVPAAELAACLADNFGVIAHSFDRLRVGENTMNYRASGERETFFVKMVERPGAADLESSVRRTLRSLSEGVRTPAAIPTPGGRFVVEHGGWAISAWHWEAGDVLTSSWTRHQADAAGLVLSTLHQTLQRIEPGEDGAVRLDDWGSGQLDPRQAARARQPAGMASCGGRPAAGHEWDEHLRWRLDRSPELIAMAAHETAHEQALHGDFSVVNLLFRGTSLSVTDFAPPQRGIIEYELGRLAFAPQFVAEDPTGWRENGRRIITAYATGSGMDARSLYRSSLLAFLIALVGSCYAFPFDSADTNPSLDLFWRQRVQTIHALDAERARLDVPRRSQK